MLLINSYLGRKDTNVQIVVTSIEKGEERLFVVLEQIVEKVYVWCVYRKAEDVNVERSTL